MSLLEEHQLLPFHTELLPCLRGSWLVFAPHPDDESFGMGGTLVKAAQSGIAVHLVVLTDGALGGSQHDLVRARQREVQKAAQVMGLHSVHFFNQPDRALPVNEQLAGELAVMITRLKPAAVFFPGVQELHPDHRRAALLVWRSLQLLGANAPQGIAYEITGQSPANCLVDISSEMAVKLLAIACYESQLVENNYLDIIKALNKLRTLTLSAGVSWAEGFYCYSKTEMHLELAEWLRLKMVALLEPASKFVR